MNNLSGQQSAVSGQKTAVSGQQSAVSNSNSTAFYLSTVNRRCRCCGQFLSLLDGCHRDARNELCVTCQWECSVQVVDLERRAA